MDIMHPYPTGNYNTRVYCVFPKKIEVEKMNGYLCQVVLCQKEGVKMLNDELRILKLQATSVELQAKMNLQKKCSLFQGNLIRNPLIR
jgi:hypothetical protein